MKKKLLGYKIKNRYLIYIIILGYVFGSFLGIFAHNIKAISVTETFTFEGFTIGQENITDNKANVNLSTRHKDRYGFFEVQSTFTHGGTRSFKQGYVATEGTGQGYFNYTYSPSKLMTRFSLYIYIVSATNYPMVFYFYNGSSRTVANRIITMQINQSGYMLNYRNYDNSYRQMVNIHAGVWYEIGFEILSNDTITYFTNGSSFTGTPNHIVDMPRLYCQQWDSTMNGVGQSYYIDDISVTIDDSFSGGGVSPCGLDYTGYPIGDLTKQNSQQVNSPSIYTDYKLPITTSIKTVELKVTNQQYIEDSNLNNYTLKINNVTVGNPVCFYAMDFYYILAWDCNIALVDEIPEFNFTHSSFFWVDTYWELVIGDDSTDDLDFDGDVLFEYNYEYEHCQWQWIFGIPFWICTTHYYTSMLYDLSYRFWTTGFTTENEYNYTDSLGLFKYMYKNSTGYVYDINSPNGIIGSYALGDDSYTYTIELYKNDTLYPVSGFPIDVSYPSGSFGYSPETIGKYTFKLKSYHYVANITAWVTGEFDDYSIRTSPVITNQFQQYDVLYRYNHPQGYNGGIALFYDLNASTEFNDAEFNNVIQNNVSDSITYYSVHDSSEYWFIYANMSGIFRKVNGYATHYIRIPSIVDNSIVFPYISMEINPGNPDGRSIQIYGNHLFPGCDVSVYINNQFVANVGDTQQFTCFYTPLIPGVYNATLRINQNGTVTILAYTDPLFTVTSAGGEIPPEEIGYGFLPPPFSYIAGAILTLLFVILPSYYIGKINIQSDILKYVPVFTGCLGFIVSCLIGFFPWYAIFILVAILVIILAVMYVSKKNQ